MCGRGRPRPATMYACHVNSELETTPTQTGTHTQTTCTWLQTPNLQGAEEEELLRQKQSKETLNFL